MEQALKRFALFGEVGGSHTHKNNYYLSGIQGIFTIGKTTGDNIFYKTSEDEEAMTTAKVVAALNSYIESNPEGVSTVGWCKWVVSADNLPILDFNTEWNGSSWVTASN